MNKIYYQKSLYFNNTWQVSLSQKKLNRSFNNKKLLFKSSNNIDLTKLIHSAEIASSSWSKYNLNDRKKIIKKISSVLQKNKKIIAKKMMIDTGKTYLDCLQELTFCHKLWEEAAKVNKKFFEKTKKLKNQTIIKEIKQPIGIVGLFIPFNNYMVVLSERLPFLLMAGSVAIIKPNEFGILGIIKFLDLIKKNVKRLPSIINLIVGEKDIGSKIVKSKKIPMIDFTGSKLVGKKISIEGSRLFKRINLELGGKNPSIITRSANLKKAAKSIIKDFTGNAGQNCVAISRVYIDKIIYKKFKDTLIQYLQNERFSQKLRNEKNTNNVLKFLNKNKKYFNQKICFGKISNNYKNFQPLVFENINSLNYIYKEELFMPILILEKFDKIKDAIKKSNDNDYGLSATLWAKKTKNNMEILSRIECGRLWLNGSIYQNFPFLHVGGLKSSGNGRVAGIDSINNYSIFKTLIINK